MKNLKNYLIEKQNFLIKNKNVLKDYDHYEYQPKTKEELQDIITDLLKQGETDLNCIDVSEITDMSLLFYWVNKKIKVKDIDISEWDVSKVKNTQGMFDGCDKFNSDLSKWNVSNITNMTSMFSNCKVFNSDLSKWNVSKVKHMSMMFYNCKNFNSDLSNWDVSNINNNTTFGIFSKCKLLIKNNKIPAWYLN